MYTLEDIYDRLDTGAAGVQNTFTEPAAGPGTGTMRDLNEIMAQAPAADNTNGAVPGEVLTGKTYWSLRTDGTWGPQAGTAAAGEDVDGPDGAKTFNIPGGLYSGKTATANDSHLQAGNIKKDVNIFGQVGTLAPGGGATAADLFDGKTAHLAGDWTLDTGTLDLACNTAVFDGSGNKIPDAYDGDGNGNNRWCMTDSGDATEADIVSGKKAWVDGVELTGTMAINPAPVPKTGQAKCYDDGGDERACAGTGEDGEHQKGVAWPDPRFTDNSDGTVTDNLTGLIWLQNANCAAAARNWQTALNDVAQLNTNGQMNGNPCGDTSNGGTHQTDWRLPNMRELYSLIHFGQADPATWLNTQGFSGVKSKEYWSSTTGEDLTTGAWNVNLGDGCVHSWAKCWSLYYVWPVRGGQ
jgi:hypothetical protein